MLKLLIAGLACVLPASAFAAAESVSLSNGVFVERVQDDGAGPARKVLAPPRSIGRGDTLVFVVSYRNRGADPASDVVVTNAVPGSVAFAGSDRPDTIVSVDGGRTWGQLASLSVRISDGRFRPAEASDVTHVRWNFPRAISAGEAGELRFRGIVK